MSKKTREKTFKMSVRLPQELYDLVVEESRTNYMSKSQVVKMFIARNKIAGHDKLFART